MSDFCSGFEFNIESESYLEIFYILTYVCSMFESSGGPFYTLPYFIVDSSDNPSPKMDLPLFEFAFCLFLFVVCISGGWRRCSEGER